MHRSVRVHTLQGLGCTNAQVSQGTHPSRVWGVPCIGVRVHTLLSLGCTNAQVSQGTHALESGVHQAQVSQGTHALGSGLHKAQVSQGAPFQGTFIGGPGYTTSLLAETRQSCTRESLQHRTWVHHS